MTVLVVAAVALAVAALAVVVMYNRFARQRTLIDASWGGVDVELTRRRDLIPQLVATVRGYADHERTLLEDLVAAREAAATHHDEAPGQLRDFEEQLGRMLAQVLARAEAYPDLKASAGFLDLQQQLAETEDRIAAARRFYNLNVGAYNARVATFPSNLVASAFGFERREFFELTDPVGRAVPDVRP